MNGGIDTWGFSGVSV